MLDGPTLANLEVLENTRDKGGEGTLLQYLSHCVTPMGKREFRRWLCNPLRHVRDINGQPFARPGGAPLPGKSKIGIGFHSQGDSASHFADRYKAIMGDAEIRTHF